MKREIKITGVLAWWQKKKQLIQLKTIMESECESLVQLEYFGRAHVFIRQLRDTYALRIYPRTGVWRGFCVLLMELGTL